MLSNPAASIPRLNKIAFKHTRKVQLAYDQLVAEPNRHKLGYLRILAHYYNSLIPSWASVLEVGCGSGELLRLLHPRKVAGIDLSQTQIEMARKRNPEGKFFHAIAEEFISEETYDYIIISETINQSADVQCLFERLKDFVKPNSRLILNFHSNLWKPILDLATALGIQASVPPSSWLGPSDIINLLDLTDWEVIYIQPRILIPIELFGLERLVNKWIAPLIPWLNMTTFLIARPRLKPKSEPMTVSVIIPARNEGGNIGAALERLPMMGAGVEVIFVEGHSRDNTWQEIQKVVGLPWPFTIRAIQQSGKGKGNAVREGFAIATGQILMILDADLTMPPEDLPKFYEVIANNRGEMANGVRLVYPMEERAMRFLNLCANKFFSIMFTYLIGQTIKDCLCGTKVLTREHYLTLAANRSYFGDFDPFGDFDLLFGAAKLNMKIVGVPVRYQERTYGETNIQRWKHGALLLRMVIFAASKLKFI